MVTSVAEKITAVVFSLSLLFNDAVSNDTSMMFNECEAVVGMKTGRGNVRARNSAILSICEPQISLDLSWE
jgi:hypothetical protein